jgi:predicted DNA-binding protein
MNTQMIIRIDPKQREKLNRLSRADGKPTSVVIREMIDCYINEHDPEAYIDDLWSKISTNISNNGYTENDIPRIIQESRKAATEK